MRAAGITRCAGRTDDLTLVDTFATTHKDLTLMGIQCLESVAMINHGHIAITKIIPASINDHAAIGGINVIAQIGGQINGQMIGLNGIIKA